MKAILSNHINLNRIRKHGEAGARVLRKRRRLRELSLFVFLIVGLSLVFVSTRVSVIEKGYTIHELSKQYESLRQQKREIQLELATLKSPQNLTRHLKGDEGLNYPSPEQVILLKETDHTFATRD